VVYMLEVLEGVLALLEAVHTGCCVENCALYAVGAVGTAGDALCAEALEVVAKGAGGCAGGSE